MGISTLGGHTCYKRFSSRRPAALKTCSLAADDAEDSASQPEHLSQYWTAALTKLYYCSPKRDATLQQFIGLHSRRVDWWEFWHTWKKYPFQFPPSRVLFPLQFPFWHICVPIPTGFSWESHRNGNLIPVLTARNANIGRVYEPLLEPHCAGSLRCTYNFHTYSENCSQNWMLITLDFDREYCCPPHLSVSSPP